MLAAQCNHLESLKMLMPGPHLLELLISWSEGLGIEILKSSFLQ